MYLDNTDHLDSCREGVCGGSRDWRLKYKKEKWAIEGNNVAHNERKKEKEESGIDGKKENE